MTSLRSENPGGIRIVFNRLLGGWYIVRGPHHTPISGRFGSKEEAKAWLEEQRIKRDMRHSNPALYVVERDGHVIGRTGTRHDAMRYAREDEIGRAERSLPESEYAVRELRYENPRHSSKWDRCVWDVAASGTAESPYAVCTAALGRKAYRARNPRYGALGLQDAFANMEQAREAAQDARTAKDNKGRPWYASVSVKDLGPEAGRLRYGLFYREVYHDNPSTEWHQARSAELALLADDMRDSPEDEEFLRRKSAEHLIQADIPAMLHQHQLFAKSEDLGQAERAAHYESTLAEERIGRIGNPRTMTARDVKRAFREEILPSVIVRYGKGDKVAIRTAFNDYVDSLQKDGQISERTADRITWGSNPRYRNYKDPGPEWEFIGSVKTKAEATSEAKRLSKSQFKTIKGIKNKTAGTWDLYGRRGRSNPRGVPAGAVKIYDRIEQIKATKGAGSLYPGEGFYHNFKGASKGKIYGLRDGSLLIKGQRPLWAAFEQNG